MRARWHQFEMERFFFFYLRKLSAYKWAYGYCIFSRATACTWPCEFLLVVDGVSLQTNYSTGFPPAFQPVMWSISTLIKLTVFPKSNQNATSLPDCVSSCHMWSVHVCGHVWKRKWTERQKKWDGQLITIFTSYFTVSTQSEEGCQGGREASLKNRTKNTHLNDETKRDPQQTVYSNEHLMEGKMEFTGFGSADNERGKSRQIVINSELFYLCGIRGINRSFGFGFCTIQSGSARQFGFLYVFVRA